MFARSVNQNFWSMEDLGTANVPDSAKQFLSTVGLPTFVNGFHVEMGVFDCDLPHLMIGGGW